MAQITTFDFSGGMSTISKKSGIKNSAQFIKALDIFEDPNYATLAKETVKKSSTTVDGLIHWLVDASPHNTNRYAYDAQGKIYKITSADAVSVLQTTSNSVGEGLLVHDDYLYYALTKNIGRYGLLSGTPAFDDDITSWWLVADLQTTGGGTGAADYVPPTSISEAATARQTFTADHDPVESITIDVDVVGSGDWTVTLHDQANRSLGTSTIANGSMGTGDQTFTLSSIARVIPGESYHFHVTSTVADGGVDTETATDLEGAEYTITYQPLLSATFHPMAEILGGWVVGNERYLGWFDNINGEFNPTKLVFAPGFEVRAVYKHEEYVVAEAWRGQSFSEAEEGRRYFWDGIESTFNYFEDIPMGAVNAATSYRNTIVGVYGNKGAIYAGSKPFTKIIDKVPKLTKGKIIQTYPGAIAEYEERLVIGYGASTDDGTNLEQGVYEFGSQAEELPNVLNFPYIVSTGTTKATNLKISALGAFGTDLYICWQSGASTYGIDKVEVGGNSTDETAEWRSRIFDAGDPNKTKQAVKLEITFEALVSGDSVTPFYDINRSGTDTTGTAVTTVGATEANLYINSNFREIEYGFNLLTTANTFPKITGVNLIFEPLEGEGEAE